ncbi:hypothetical protein ROZALSC1DRAFT_26181 [Rozella allomycis CSF55]|uniref:Uncharacterized protein n=1 Tax=Rozella allomycis (strain CSF55) TaxID=988480 RepID=A0A4P9YC16_ROZAC|nr:hypothetical protein ROZALSC1DRAFT_26181 [Rozella allomycis CSF55]
MVNPSLNQTFSNVLLNSNDNNVNSNIFLTVRFNEFHLEEFNVKIGRSVYRESKGLLDPLPIVDLPFQNDIFNKLMWKLIWLEARPSTHLPIRSLCGSFMVDI